MSCFERFVLIYIKSNIPIGMDRQQFTYQGNRIDQVDHALNNWVLMTLQSGLWMLLGDFSFTFNTTDSHKLVKKKKQKIKHCTLLRKSFFLSNRLLNVRVGHCTWSIYYLIMNSGRAQDCVSIPAPFMLFVHACIPIQPSNTMMTFVDNTIILGLITGRMNSTTESRFNILSGGTEKNIWFLNEIVVGFWTRKTTHKHKCRRSRKCQQYKIFGTPHHKGFDMGT